MRECNIGESGGEQIRDWVAPVSSTSFHSTGYPGDLKFPGRSDQYFSIFRLVGNRQQLDISLWTDSVRRQQIIYHIIGNEGGGTPALQLPDGKGRRRGGENPAGGARGGRRCEGELRFFLQNANISSSSQSTRELWIGGRLHVHVPVFSREESESEKV